MTTDQLRALAARLQNFADRKAALAAERERIIAAADPALDDRTLARFAATAAGLDLAKIAEDRLLAQVRDLGPLALYAEDRIRDLRDQVLAALRRILLAKVPAELQGGVNVEGSDTYKAELQAGYAPNTSSFKPTGYGQSVEVTLAHLRDQVIPELERCDAEEARLRKRLAKLT